MRFTVVPLAFFGLCTTHRRLSDGGLYIALATTVAEICLSPCRLGNSSSIDGPPFPVNNIMYVTSHPFLGPTSHFSGAWCSYSRSSEWYSFRRRRCRTCGDILFFLVMRTPLDGFADISGQGVWISSVRFAPCSLHSPLPSPGISWHSERPLSVDVSLSRLPSHDHGFLCSRAAFGLTGTVTQRILES
ncbi:hypothetical protein BKA82DRAFT_2429252 [Pisolithus tinctorius]|nr:hypothetical protein BKA82DRAFT_2429252 [Pisolithus tinctorius]